MKAIRIQEYGGASAIEEVAEPLAAPGQVVVRNVATGLNPIDQGRASGMMKQMFPLEFPWTPGGDVAGVVKAIGPGVSGFKVGDAVFGYTPAGGAYAEHVVIDAAALAHKPATLTHEQAAAVAVVGQTAVQMLDLAGLRAGQSVLIHGGSGSVGSLAIQLAHTLGTHVTTTARKAQEASLLRLGADKVIDYTTQRFEDEVEPVDAVLDLVGGETQARSYAVVKRGGVLVAANQPPDPKQCEARGIRGAMVQSQVTTDALNKLAGRVAAGDLVPTVASVETLWDPQGIWAKRESGSSVGKVVFRVSAS